jgi:ankyrin repeat protein
MVRLLIEKGADVNAKNEDRRTPLQLAGHKDVAAILAEAMKQQGSHVPRVDKQRDSKNAPQLG